jgi:hypothetical protein
MMRRLKAALWAVAKVIGRVQTWILLTAFYIVLLAPVALIFKLLADPLHLRRRPSIWCKKELPADRMTWARGQ